ncbi:MAG: DUF1015 domain-containing protein [Ruminococcaceae bacterium]|nr:DUF1015 domain-containing protein [Oscillospiraceae bacterium]
MAVVKPFKGLRFQKSAGPIEELVCPPYDIISEEQRKAFLATNEHNVIRLELPKEGDDIYKKAGEVLNSWLENDVVATEAEDKFYIYEEEFVIDGVKKNFKGVIARVKLTDFSEGVVIPHENTLSAAKEDRFNLMCATGCNFSQVYCLFEDKDKKITDVLDTANQTPIISELTDNEGVTHRLWALDSNSGLTELFTDKCLYIADGHHRYETALRYRQYERDNGAAPDAASEYVMMMLVPMESEGLVVFPTHRVVHSLEEFDGRQMLINAREYFHVGEISSYSSLERNLKEEYDLGKISFGAYFDGRYYLLTLKTNPTLEDLLPELHETLRTLDVSVLHSLILEKLMGIDKENMAKQINLRYTRDADEAAKQVDDGANCAFFLNPTRVEQIAAVGSAGQKMPQKSTYFYPKLITGLVMNKIK